MSKELVFVYGTLKKGLKNHYYLDNEEFIGDAYTEDIFPMLNIEKTFPYLFKENGVGYQIKGELYNLSTKKISELDILEDVPSLFFLDTIAVICDEIKLKAFVYFATLPLHSFVAQSPLLEEYREE